MFDRTFTKGLFGLSALTLLAACQSPYASTTHEPGIQPPTPNFPVRPEAAAAPASASVPIAAPPPVRADVSRGEDRPVTLLEPGDPEPPVTTSVIPAPSTNPPAPQPTVVAAAPPPPARPAPPPPAPVMETRFVTTGPVVDAEGPSTQSHTVKSGETLYSISRSMGMTVKQAAEINGLKEPYTLKVGQRIKGKPSRGKAYVVQSGDTLSAIGRRFSVSASQIAAANDQDVGDAIRPGQKLLLPSGFKDLGAQQIQVASVAPAPVAAPPPARSVPAANTPTAPPPRPAMPPPATTTIAAAPPPAPRPSNAPAIIPTTPPAGPADIAAAGRGRFIWPVSGRQLNGFGSRGGNQVSNGLNIAAAVGTAVKAAAPGQVIYAGSEVQGYGNLVLVQHADGFVSVYAHLSKINVSMRDQVRQGQEIGQVGQTGGVTEPQLYFEMRHQPTPRDQHKPFDPTLVLPER